VTEDASPPADQQPTIRVLAMPADANPSGDIFGGWIASQVDLAGSIAAYRRARGRIVTVAINSLEFHQPVLVGDLVSCYPSVERVGRTSITVRVQVFAERTRHGGDCVKVTEATLVYVAVDDQRRPRPVPPEPL
jgi:acyl-CoA thioesterase YciA